MMINRTERQIEEDDVEYAEGVKAYDTGYADGLAGRPSNGDADHYASGYEEGVADREVDDDKVTCPYCARRLTLTPTGKFPKHFARPGNDVCARSGSKA